MRDMRRTLRPPRAVRPDLDALLMPRGALLIRRRCRRRYQCDVTRWDLIYLGLTVVLALASLGLIRLFHRMEPP